MTLKALQNARQEIESLKQQLAECQAKNAELTELNEYANSAYKTKSAEAGGYQIALAECQATNGMLRVALRNSYVELFHCNQQLTSVLDENDDPIYTTGKTVSDSLNVSKSLLDAKQDTTALNELITKAGEVMRERCVNATHQMIQFEVRLSDVRREIRAIPGVTLEDLK